MLKQFVNNSVASTGRTSILSYANDIVGTEFRTKSQYEDRRGIIQMFGNNPNIQNYIQNQIKSRLN